MRSFQKTNNHNVGKLETKIHNGMFIAVWHGLKQKKSSLTTNWRLKRLISIRSYVIKWRAGAWRELQSVFQKLDFAFRPQWASMALRNRALAAWLIQSNDTWNSSDCAQCDCNNPRHHSSSWQQVSVSVEVFIDSWPQTRLWAFLSAIGQVSDVIPTLSAMLR